LIRNNRFEDIRNKANKVRTIDLGTLLQHFGCSKDPQDKAKWHTPQGIISVNGQKFMNWTQNTGGGGAIDLIIHLKKIEFKDAVLWLCDKFSFPSIQREPTRSNTLKRILKLPQKNQRKLQQVMQYLRDERCIPGAILKNLILSKKLYADNRGNAVFLLLGKKKRIVGAELRGTYNTQWRGMAPGSKKHLGCFYIIGESSKKMVLCESAIDAISCAVLFPEHTAISTSGATANPAWLQKFLINGCEIYCGFDIDSAGDLMADKMITQHPSIKRLRPPLHDWNETLQNLHS
jgi:hypothetical protein